MASTKIIRKYDNALWSYSLDELGQMHGHSTKFANYFELTTNRLNKNVSHMLITCFPFCDIQTNMIRCNVKTLQEKIHQNTL